MPDSSPYSYAANNPVCMVDVDGLAPEGGPEKQKPNASNLAKPYIMKDDHGPTTGDARNAVDSELAYRQWATSTYISVDHVGEAKAAEDQWLKKWQGMSFGDKWHYQDKAFAIINRQNYEEWVDSGNNPEQFHPMKTLKEGWAGVNEAAFYSLGGVQSSGKGTFTGAFTPSPVRDYSVAPGYSATFVTPEPKGPAVLPSPGLEATQEVGKPVSTSSSSPKSATVAKFEAAGTPSTSKSGAPSIMAGGKPSYVSPEIKIKTSSKLTAPSIVYTIYDEFGGVFKFGVSDAGGNRLKAVMQTLGNNYRSEVTWEMTKAEAHWFEKYFTSLYYSCNGKMPVGMKVPYAHDLVTGLRIGPNRN